MKKLWIALGIIWAIMWVVALTCYADYDSDIARLDQKMKILSNRIGEYQTVIDNCKADIYRAQGVKLYLQQQKLKEMKEEKVKVETIDAQVSESDKAEITRGDK